MNLFLYSEMQHKIEKSGVGRAIYHQRECAVQNKIHCVETLDKADVIHINTIFPHSFLMALKAKKRGIPVIYHAHSTREDFKNSYLGSNLFANFFQKWIMLCYRQGDIIITPSAYAKQLLEGYGITQEIRALSNGINLDEYVKDEEAGNRFRHRYGYTEHDKIIMSAGLMIKRKGILDFAALAKRMPQYQFIWFGSSNLYAVGSAVRHVVKNPPPNLRFAGYVEKEELQAAYSGSDLFLFPSYEETEGIVILEALAMKIPVLLRDIPVYSDWLTDRREVYKARNIDEFASLTESILSEKLPLLTENGYQVVSQRDIKKIGHRLCDIYISCIRKHQKAKKKSLYRITT